MKTFAFSAEATRSFLELRDFEALEWASFVAGDEYLPARAVREKWVPLTLRLCGPKSLLQDAYPAGHFAGISLIVSDRFRAMADGQFPGQCEFLPLNVDRVRSGFHALWVNGVRDDAINATSSELVSAPGNSHGVKRISFDPLRLGGLAIFKLSPKFIGTQDFVTEAFQERALAANLKGLRFWDRS